MNGIRADRSRIVTNSVTNLHFGKQLRQEAIVEGLIFLAAFADW
jgi:hypothetical protein